MKLKAVFSKLRNAARNRILFRTRFRRNGNQQGYETENHRHERAEERTASSTRQQRRRRRRIVRLTAAIKQVLKRRNRKTKASKKSELDKQRPNESSSYPLPYQHDPSEAQQQSSDASSSTLFTPVSSLPFIDTPSRFQIETYPKFMSNMNETSAKIDSCFSRLEKNQDREPRRKIQLEDIDQEVVKQLQEERASQLRQARMNKRSSSSKEQSFNSLFICRTIGFIVYIILLIPMTTCFTLLYAFACFLSSVFSPLANGSPRFASMSSFADMSKNASSVMLSFVSADSDRKADSTPKVNASDVTGPNLVSSCHAHSKMDDGNGPVVTSSQTFHHQKNDSDDVELEVNNAVGIEAENCVGNVDKTNEEEDIEIVAEDPRVWVLPHRPESENMSFRTMPFPSSGLWNQSMSD